MQLIPLCPTGRATLARLVRGRPELRAYLFRRLAHYGAAGLTHFP